MMLANQGNFPAIVKLNVGGQHFTTSLQTLARDPTSMLAAMFSGRHEVQTTEDGSFFIDRDGTYFRFILNYLRDGELILPEGATFLAELEAEARFYQVQGILNELRTTKASNVFEESVILRNEEHRRVLKDCLPLVGEWRLLFRASRDGFAASVFHSKCDHKGPTITVVKSGGSIFGGFTENPWKSQGGYIPCKKAFLFTLVNPFRLGPAKMPVILQLKQYAMRCCSSHGPVFGGGTVGDVHDLFISDNPNTNTISSSHLGKTYQWPQEGQQFLFTGGPKFTVTDYEVFGLYQ